MQGRNVEGLGLLFGSGVLWWLAWMNGKNFLLFILFLIGAIALNRVAAELFEEDSFGRIMRTAATIVLIITFITLLYGGCVLAEILAIVLMGA